MALVRHSRRCFALLAVLPVALRLALLAHHPVPTPQIHDEFSQLLAAGTLAHFRLANPPHPLSQFFETIYVLQQPTYSSIYAIGQGLALATGQLLFGLPWAGVLLSGAALCALCYWMLRGWTSPGWALLGGVFAVIQFGPLCVWTNTYWGGAVSACAGCLVFGALPRLRALGRVRDAALLGLGFSLQMLSRPFESIPMALAILIYFAPEFRSLARLRKPALVAALAFVPGVALTLLHDYRVTGSWSTLPYALSRYQYGVPTTFTFQPVPEPHVPLTREQQIAWRVQSWTHGTAGESPARYLRRFVCRLHFYRFYFSPVLLFVLPAALLAFAEFRFAWLALTIVLFALADNFYPFFFPHYVAAIACLCILLAVTALERIARFTPRGSAVVAALALAPFAVCYGAHFFDDSRLAMSLRSYESFAGVNHDTPNGRVWVRGLLAQIPGKLLVFVYYGSRHRVTEEWVYNAADIDASRIVWARDLGPAENEKLRRYYPDRNAWRLDPDAAPPSLTPYTAATESNRSSP